MKILFTTLFLLAGMVGFSQDKFTFTKEGFTDFVVTPVDGKTQAQLYKKALDWVAVTFKNPKEVIKANIENDYIRIEGSNNSFVCASGTAKICLDAKYQIEISFKDGRYKFDLIDLSTFAPASEFGPGGWTNLDLQNVEPFYNKKGEIKGAYKNYPVTIPGYFNDLNNSLKVFASSDAIPSKKSDW